MLKRIGLNSGPWQKSKIWISVQWPAKQSVKECCQ